MLSRFGSCMRGLPQLLLVLMLAFALSGAEALASDCCARGCCEQARHPGKTGAPSHGGDKSSHSVPCNACPCARVVTPVLGEAPALPEPAPAVLSEWWEPPMKPASPHTRGVFQPPRAG